MWMKTCFSKNLELACAGGTGEEECPLLVPLNSHQMNGPLPFPPTIILSMLLPTSMAVQLSLLLPQLPLLLSLNIQLNSYSTSSPKVFLCLLFICLLWVLLLYVVTIGEIGTYKYFIFFHSESIYAIHLWSVILEEIPKDRIFPFIKTIGKTFYLSVWYNMFKKKWGLAFIIYSL